MEIFEFGAAPQAKAAGYELKCVVHSTADDLKLKHEGEDLIFVFGASIHGQPGVYEFARFERNISKKPSTGFLDSAGTYYPSLQSVQTYMPVGRTFKSADDPLAVALEPMDAIDDPKFRLQMQGLKDMTAAIHGVPTGPVVFSTDPGSVLNM